MQYVIRWLGTSCEATFDLRANQRYNGPDLHIGADSSANSTDALRNGIDRRTPHDVDQLDARER